MAKDNDLPKLSAEEATKIAATAVAYAGRVGAQKAEENIAMDGLQAILSHDLHRALMDKEAIQAIEKALASGKLDGAPVDSGDDDDLGGDDTGDDDGDDDTRLTA